MLEWRVHKARITYADVRIITVRSLRDTFAGIILAQCPASLHYFEALVIGTLYDNTRKESRS